MINKNNKGVTLIELLVVITIMMTMISLVAPLAINTVDKAEAQSEFLSFCGVLRQASVRAFANGSGIEVTLHDSNLVANISVQQLGTIQQENSKESNVIIKRTYKHLNFPYSEIIFNRNGMPNLTTITINQRNQKKQYTNPT